MGDLATVRVKHPATRQRSTGSRWRGPCTATWSGPDEWSPYRYALTCRWGEGPLLVCVGINPSTADTSAPDPTCVRWMSHAARWGFEAITVLNLWPLRATDFRLFLKGEGNINSMRLGIGLSHDPSDPVEVAEYQATVARVLAEGELVLCSWGSGVKQFGDTPSIVASALATSPIPKCALGFTRDGHPVHPLARMAGLRTSQAWPLEWPRPARGEPRILSTPRRPAQLGLLEP